MDLESPAPRTGADDNPFAIYVASQRDAIDSELAGCYALSFNPDVKRYLTRPLQDFCAHGGKRVRPALVLLSAECLGGSRAAALPAGAAIEQFQTAALIHDDIADESDTRRGLPAMHITQGAGLAINNGDYALVESFSSVLEDERIDDSHKLLVLTEISEMMLRTVEGQALDLGWARDGRWDLDVEDYLAMAILKTAYYSAGSPLAIGAILSNANNEVVEELRQAGLDAGLAFQIKDDLLNLYGNPEAVGKDYRGDITEGKRTFCALWAISQGSQEQRESLVSILSSHTADPAQLEEAVHIMEETGAIRRANQTAQDYARRAQKRLEGLDLADTPAKQALLAMPSFFVDRKI